MDAPEVTALAARCFADATLDLALDLMVFGLLRALLDGPPQVRSRVVPVASVLAIEVG